MNASSIPGYTLGRSDVGRSPVDLATFAQMKTTALFGDADVEHLRASHDVLAPRTDAILDVWYGFVGGTPHLAASFSRPGGELVPEYLAGVRRRFARWILDTASARYDQAWLDYQHEIGLRHFRTKKNQTDGVEAAPLVPFRDLFLLTVPITTTLRPFLEKGDGITSGQVDAMHAAWVKSVLLQVTLWSYAYVGSGSF